jgi:hypothetical protein
VARLIALVARPDSLLENQIKYLSNQKIQTVPESMHPPLMNMT